MRWSIRWEDDAVGDLLGVASSDRSQARRIRQRITTLANTGEGDIRKLEGREDEWRLRVGDWRVFFTYQREARVLMVLAVRRRNEATYRD